MELEEVSELKRLEESLLKNQYWRVGFADLNLKVPGGRHRGQIKSFKLCLNI